MLSAIIQARLNSKRFPRKVFAGLCGKPVLYYVIENARRAVNDVIVATPDEEIADYALEMGVMPFIGDEDDVLDRYYQTSLEFKVSDIVRLTADNPLVYPEIIRKVVEKYQTGIYDYVSNNLVRTYPVGQDVEVFSFETLQAAWQLTEKPYDREHVTPFIRESGLFELGNVENETKSDLRLTIDTREDLENVRKYMEAANVSLR